MKRGFTVWLLVAALLFLAAGGFYGGISMLLDPSGRGLQMDEILPLILCYGLLARPEWDWAHQLAGWSGHHWAWSGAVGLALVLLAWLSYQAFLIGFRWPIQYVTAANGLVILILALAPGVRRAYQL